MGCDKSSHQRCSVKKCSQKFHKIHRKTPVPGSLINKAAGLRPATLLKKETLAQVFSCEFCEISKKTFLQNTSGRLLLMWKKSPSCPSYSNYFRSSHWRCSRKKLFLNIWQYIHMKTPVLESLLEPRLQLY